MSVTYEMIERLMVAVEGECDGLAIDAGQALAILSHVMEGSASPAGVKPLEDLEEVREAVFGDVGDEPDVYADYDRCSELSGKMRKAIEALRSSRIMSAIEPAGVGVETPPPSSHVVASAAAADVLAERRRQVEAEGWTPAHDDAHKDCSLAKAAAIYTVGATLDGPDRAVMDAHGASGTPGWMKELWPWGIEWWKPTDRRRDLVKAGALIIAEIERLDRAATEGKDNG